MKERTESVPAKWVVLVICLVFWLGMLFAAPSLQSPTHAIGRDQSFVYHHDSSGLSLEQFLALPPEATVVGTRPFTQGYSSKPYWLRFEAPRHWFQEGPLWLQLTPGYLDHITLYWRPIGGEGAWQERRAGDRDDPAVRLGDLDYRFPVFKLPPPPDEAAGYEFVARLESTSALMFEPAFWEPSAFVSYATRDSVFWAFFLGMSALSSALSVLLAVGLKSRLLWSVVPFSVGYLLVACIQGYVGWSDSAWRVTLQHYLIGVLTLLGYPALLWMCVEALDLRRHFPRGYRIALGGVLISLLLPLSIPLGIYGHAVAALTVAALLTAPALFGCALALWWRTKIGYLNLVFGLIPMFYIVSSLLALFTTTALISYDPVVYHFWQYCVMMVMMIMMLLVMAVGVMRIRRERRIHYERVRLEQELARERQARVQQRQFMGMISHELRTPLAVISAALANLKSVAGQEPAIGRRYDKIDRATRRLVQLTDNCLADARLSAGDLYLDRQPTDLLEEVRQVLALTEPDEDRSMRITLEGAPMPSRSRAQAVPLVADGALLRIALSNLLDNAIKYSVAGGDIRLDVYRQGGQWIVAVEDAGPGVPDEQAAAIFDRYRQADETGGGRQGWGLGLHVARQIALAHGGDLVLADNQRHRCRFELRLPAAAADKITAAMPGTITLQEGTR